MGRPLGRDCLVQYNSATYSSPTWVTVADVVDLTINDEAETVEVDVRGANYKTNEVAAKTLGISFNLKSKSGSATLTALEAAYDAKTVLDMRLVRGADTTGNAYRRADFLVSKCEETQSVGDVVEHAIELVLAENSHSVVRGTIS